MRIRTHKKQFAIVSNATAQSDYLSWGALGLLTYCLSMPEDWDFRPQVIWKETKGGRNQLYGLFNELIEQGHCIRVRQQHTHPNMQHLPGEIRYEIFDDMEDCKSRCIELSSTEKFIECKEDFKKSFRYPKNWDSNSCDAQSRVAESWEEYKETDSYKETDTKETTTTETHAAVVSSEKFNQDHIKSYQSQSKSQPYDKPVPLKIHKCLEKVDIPDADKQEISKMYDADTVKNAIAWATDARNPPKVCVAASTKFACSRGLSDKDLKQPKKEDQKPPFDPYPFNKAYWRQIQSRIGRTNIRECNDYLELPNDKLYFKDRSFLEQISCYLRKKGALPEIFQLIKQCQQDLNNQ